MGERQSVSFVHSLLLSVQVFKMESHTKRFLRIFLFSSATFLQYLQSSSSSSFSGHTPPFLPSHFFIQGSYSGSLVFSALDEKEQESEFVAVNPARRSHRQRKRKHSALKKIGKRKKREFQKEHELTRAFNFNSHFELYPQPPSPGASWAWGKLTPAQQELLRSEGGSIFMLARFCLLIFSPSS